MATRIKPTSTKLYEENFYVWTERQAELLRARRFDELDLDNLIEEVESLGRAEKSRVANNARVILEHLLKLQYSPATEPRNKWRATVREYRRRLENDLTPHLRQILLDDLGRQYVMARDDAGSAMCDHGEQAAANAQPETCPYALDQITGDWMPEQPRPHP